MSSIHWNPMHPCTVEVFAALPDGSTVKVGLLHASVRIDQATNERFGPVMTTVTITGTRTGMEMTKPKPSDPLGALLGMITKEQARHQENLPVPSAVPAPSTPRDLESIRSL